MSGDLFDKFCRENLPHTHFRSHALVELNTQVKLCVVVDYANNCSASTASLQYGLLMITIPERLFL